MPKTVKFSFTSKKTGESGSAEATFSDADWDRLLEFVAEAERLFATQAIRNGFSVNNNVRWDRDSGLTTTVRLPADDDVAAVLHRLRPFILEQERSNFLSICNLLASRLDHPGLRATIAWHRELFAGKQFQSMVTIKSDHLLLNSMETLKLWLNAFEYHRDPDKQKELESAHAIFPIESTKAIVLSMVIDMIKAIGAIAAWIDAMRRGEGAQITLKANAVPPSARGRAAPESVKEATDAGAGS